MGGTLTFLTPGTWLPHCENGGMNLCPWCRRCLQEKQFYAYSHEPHAHIEKTNGCLHFKTMPSIVYHVGRN